MLVELDDEIRRMNNDDYMNKHKVNRIGAGVIVDENDLEYEASLDRMARMKTICNKLKIIHREKSRSIEQLAAQLSMRNDMDQQLVDEVVASEGLLRRLHERNGVVERGMEEARRVEAGYKALLLVLKKNPPFQESHVQSMEVEVELAEKQLAALCLHRSKLYEEVGQHDLHQRETILEQIEYFEHARGEVALKKKAIVREIRQVPPSIRAY
ncbi:hypothetical protein B484DRAFT_211846 [Ochromonadaceae sp. CCMP2298]|nr:hypothetical protein B484DRAFT_211846 [Ochromonadaceae sp. CCMP2298]